MCLTVFISRLLLLAFFIVVASSQISPLFSFAPAKIIKTSEKYKACFNIFLSECRIIFEVYLKDTENEQNNIKLA